MNEDAPIAKPEDFAPARRKLHQEIVHRLLDGYEPNLDGPPDAVLTAGGPGSGKSTLVRERLLASPGAVRISGDVIKTMLPEWRQLREEGRLGEAGIGTEGGHVAGMTLREAARRKLDLVYDNTFGGPLSLRLEQLHVLRDAGYHITLHGVDVPEEIAMERAARRAQNSDQPEDKGRDVSEAKLRLVHRQAARNLLALQHLADESAIFDNSGTGPVLFFRRLAGANPEVYDQDKYAAYQAKAALAD